MDWITGKIDTDTLILWLYGPAGAGKSAIAQTIAELCHKEGLLLATLRTDPTRNNVQRLVATLMYKAILSIPATRALVEQIVEGDPLVFKTSLETQFKKLIIEPLIHLFQSGVFQQFRFPPLVILDGLDECIDRNSQRILLEALSHSSRQHQLPLKFLVASRPEQIINASFKSSALKTLTYRLPLNNDLNPDDDIRTFLLSEFEEIRNTHPVGSSIPSSWPSDEDIDRLVSKSSGQFIYGSLVIRFLRPFATILAIACASCLV
ncbi:hypothetical protein NLJ89_g5158 [Agrocybe chaxingu]|uniref:Nephrocystin 3-like N-terminal domain-containing protein n=1 Tax=Agrocybe chaxingu TaxID=84603 RepID=A0A9W8MVV7_9AGAR|nr:hypothetical protein NLJ89_g5158 [Agrocybe chaxingu]